MWFFKGKKKAKKKLKNEFKCPQCGSVLQSVLNERSKYYCPECKINYQKSKNQ